MAETEIAHMQNKQAAGYLYAVDGIRFFAANLVAFFHITYSVWANPNSGGRNFVGSDYAFPLISQFSKYGWVGMEIFFVISGLVIANSAYNSTPRQFLKSRFLRLYPTVWICATITLIFTIFAGGYDSVNLLQRYLHSVFLIPLYPWIDPAYWTLAVEMVFYSIIFALSALGMMRNLGRLAVAFALIGFFYQFLLFLKNISILDAFPDLPLQVSRLLMLDFGSFFAVGIFAWAHINKVRVHLFPVFLTMSFIGAWLGLINHTIKTSHYIAPINDWRLTTFDAGVVLLLWSLCCILMFSSNKINDFAIFSNKNNRYFFRSIGLLTFPLYLLHFIPGVIMTDRINHYFASNGAIALFISLAVLYFISWCVYFWLEPILRNFSEPWVNSILGVRANAQRKI